MAGHPIEQVPLLALLEPDLRQRVRRRLSQRRLGAGKILFQKGEAADALYLVETGRLRVFVGERAGQERVLRFVGARDIVGEAAFMADTAHNTTAVAVEDSVVWRLGRSDFDALLGRDDGALRYLAAVIAERQSQANARLAAESAAEEDRAPRGFVTAVYSTRGGSGVTTLATSLAVALAEAHPDDTVLLDLDVLFGHVVSNLWLEPRGSLANVAPTALQAFDRSALDHYLTRHASSLRVMVAATRPEEGQNIGADHVRAAVSTLRGHFGHIVLDLPHSFSDVTLTALEHSDRIVVVVTPEPLAVRDALESKRLFQDALHLPAERIGYVVNQPSPYAAMQPRDIGVVLGSMPFEVPFGGEAPATAALRGEALVNARPNNPVARAASVLARSLSAEARERAALSGRFQPP